MRCAPQKRDMFFLFRGTLMILHWNCFFLGGRWPWLQRQVSGPFPGFGLQGQAHCDDREALWSCHYLGSRGFFQARGLGFASPHRGQARLHRRSDSVNQRLFQQLFKQRFTGMISTSSQVNEVVAAKLFQFHNGSQQIRPRSMRSTTTI